jgi:dTDP-4-dehydrorhamnose reductase
VYSLRRDSFVSKVLGWARKNETLRIVDDQISNPTWARVLAETTALILARAGDNFLPWLAERKGLYHLAGSGFTSRFEWAQAILQNIPDREEQMTTEIRPSLTSDFPTAAQRPLFSALDCSKFEQTFALHLPDWEVALKLALDSFDDSLKRVK